MIRFERKKDGKLIAYKNGNRIGQIETMGDKIIQETSKDNADSNRKNKTQAFLKTIRMK